MGIETNFGNYVGKMELPKVFEMNDNGIINSISRSIKSKPYSIHNININGILKSEKLLSVTNYDPNPYKIP